jgi:DNA-binding response OmpR family regulator
MRVLVVDGNMAIQEILFDMLTLSGQKVGTVGTVDDAEKCLARFKPEVILLDAAFCGEDGPRFLDAVDRDLPEGRPKIFTLVKDDVPDNIRTDGHIRKPLKSAEVLEVISALEGGEKGRLLEEMINNMDTSPASERGGDDKVRRSE